MSVRGHDGAGPAAGELLQTALGQELSEFGARVLGDRRVGTEAAAAALGAGPASRLELIARTAVEARQRLGNVVPVAPNGHVPSNLAEAVTSELIVANAALPNRQREALALRDLLHLSYDQIGAVMSLEGPAVASLLARARLLLRAELRGGVVDVEPRCTPREHALRLLARRQDSEPIGTVDLDWLYGHMAECPGCERAHAAMLEASIRYRAWGRP